MFNRSLWSWPILIPIAALHGCSPAVDGSPFEEATSTASSAGGSSNGSSSGNRPTTTSTPAAPTSPSATASPSPAPAGLGNEQAGPLPVAPAAGGAGTGGAPVAPPAPQNPSPVTPAAPPVQAGELDPLECASYETGFLPLVHEPVCSSCHTNNGGLPRFEPFAQAQSRCAQIGREVASGDMPPNGRLSADQLAVVASWVSLGCPETAEDAAPLCAASPGGNNPAPPPPPAAGGGDDDDDDDDGGDDDDDDDRGGDDDDGDDDDD